MAIEAGKFDPIPAQFMQKRIDLVNHEQITRNADEVLFYETWVRFPFLSRSGMEIQTLRRAISSNQTTVRIRRDDVSIQIDPSMTMIHNGQRYGIISINPIPSDERDEIELLVQYEKKATNVAKT